MGVEDAAARALALQAQNCPEAALAVLESALAQRPDDLDLAGLRAAILIELRRFEAAAAAAEAILATAPDHIRALNTLAVVLVEFNRLGDAFAVFRRAFALAPTNAELIANYGSFLSYAGAHDAAIAAYGAAVAIRPDDPEIAVNRGMTLLRAGHLEEGWRAFEHRRRQRDPAELAGTPPLPELATGIDLSGKAILVFHEQGFGDTLQFIRYAPMLADRGARVILRMPPALARIAARADPRIVVIGSDAAAPPVDFVAPMISLPRIFGTVLETIPAAVPYLSADPAEQARWAERLAILPRPRIGLVWAGSPVGGLDHRRSLPFEIVLPLFDLPGSFVSLQKGPAGDAWAPPPGVASLDPTAELDDFADTAAVVANLDLVIAVDTSTAHLAGALARPVWVLDRFDNCWRWLSARADSPWYPSLSLFRQPKPGDWAGAVAAARAAGLAGIGSRALSAGPAPSG
jgi:Flp pilus assembly protein TadD